MELDLWSSANKYYNPSLRSLGFSPYYKKDYLSGYGDIQPKQEEEESTEPDELSLMFGRYKDMLKKQYGKNMLTYGIGALAQLPSLFQGPISVPRAPQLNVKVSDMPLNTNELNRSLYTGFSNFLNTANKAAREMGQPELMTANLANLGTKYYEGLGSIANEANKITGANVVARNQANLTAGQANQAAEVDRRKTEVVINQDRETQKREALTNILKTLYAANASGTQYAGNLFGADLLKYGIGNKDVNVMNYLLGLFG